MAGDWLKIEKDTPEKLEVLAMATRLGMDPDLVFAKCFKVWRWADTHTSDGTVQHLPPTVIDDITRTPGFAHALAEVGWLHIREGALQIPNFGRHMGHSAKKRLDAADRQRRHRSRLCHASVTGRDVIPRPLRRQVYERDGHTCVYCGFKKGSRPPAGEYVGATISLDHLIPLSKGGDTTLENLVTCCTACNNRKNGRTPEEAGMSVTRLSQNRVTESVTREEKRREEKRGIPPLPPFPPTLDTPDFRAAWGDWLAHRRECKKPVTPRSAAECFRKFEAWGVARAVAAIRHSIAGGYQGVFEDKGNGNGRAAGPDLYDGIKDT